MKKITVKIGYVLLMALFCLSCSQGGDGGDDQVGSKVTVRARLSGEKVTKADMETLPDGSYYFYLPHGSFKDPMESDRRVYSYTQAAGSLTGATQLYWDDIKADAANRSNTTFYFTNTNHMEFPSGTSDDIMWGEAKGWMQVLDFKLQHSMAKMSITILDQTIGATLDFKNAKIKMTQGLIRKAIAFNRLTGVVTADNNREAFTVTDPLTEAQANTANTDDEYTFSFGILPPQHFEAGTQLEITAGMYVFRIPMPEKLDDGTTPVQLNQGEHLHLTVKLTEETINLEATLENWDEKTDESMEVTRVFNISSLNELRDLVLAVNTGYSFEGMVVRLTKDIDVLGQINLGDTKHPFKGIFDGNGKKIKGLGSDIGGNNGGFFGYTEGATLQNITLVAPAVYSENGKPLGALVDRAVNTTIFNCSIIMDGSNEGEVLGSGDCTGGMVGIATGKSSLTNCYTTILVQAGGADYTGGLVGKMEGTIAHCSSKGHVDGGSFTGGLAGITQGVVSNSFAWGDVSGNGSKTGGLVGLAEADVYYSYAAGNVVGSIDAGGLLGSVGFGVTIKYSYWNHNNSNGLGAGSLNSTCEAFALGSDIVDGKLDKENSRVWKYSDSGVFDGNRMAIFE